MDPDAVLRVTVGGGVALLVLAVGVAVSWRAVRDLRLRLTGRPVEAVVVRTLAEHDRDLSVHDWTVVDFTDAEGREQHDVRLRTWSTVPPRPGRRIRVWYSPADPRDADRSRWPLLVGRLLVAPALTALAALVVVAVLSWRS